MHYLLIPLPTFLSITPTTLFSYDFSTDIYNLIKGVNDIFTFQTIETSILLVTFHKKKFVVNKMFSFFITLYFIILPWDIFRFMTEYSICRIGITWPFLRPFLIENRYNKYIIIIHLSITATEGGKIKLIYAKEIIIMRQKITVWIPHSSH